MRALLGNCLPINSVAARHSRRSTIPGIAQPAYQGLCHSTIIRRA